MNKQEVTDYLESIGFTHVKGNYWMFVFSDKYIYVKVRDRYVFKNSLKSELLEKVLKSMKDTERRFDMLDEFY